MEGSYGDGYGIRKHLEEGWVHQHALPPRSQFQHAIGPRESFCPAKSPLSPDFTSTNPSYTTCAAYTAYGQTLPRQINDSLVSSALLLSVRTAG